MAKSCTTFCRTYDKRWYGSPLGGATGLNARRARVVVVVVAIALGFVWGCVATWAGEQPTPPGRRDDRASIVVNSNFEKADPTDPARPLGWDKPDGLGIQWATAPPGPDGKDRGKAIRLNTAVSEKALNEQRQKLGITEWLIPRPTANAVAETYGLSYYSAPMPVEPGRTYRVSFDFKGPSGGAKVWVRGWGLIQGQKRRRYETWVKCSGATDQWTSFSQEFHPTKNRPEVTEMRVMLFAYYPPSVYWFDNVKIEPVSP